MKNVRMIVAPVSGDIDRQDLERIEGESFETMDDVIIALGCDKFEHYKLVEYMDCCNNTDSETIEQEFENIIITENNWIGYITLNK